MKQNCKTANLTCLGLEVSINNGAAINDAGL